MRENIVSSFFFIAVQFLKKRKRNRNTSTHSSISIKSY